MADSFKKDINALKRHFTNLKHEIQARVTSNKSDQAQAYNINFKGRTNIQASKNIYQPGMSTFSSTSQDAPIDQRSSSTETS